MSDKLVAQGRSEIRETQKKYNKKIEKAPARSSYNKFTGKYDDNKSTVRRAKTDAIKDIVQDYQLLGVALLDGDELKALDEE